MIKISTIAILIILRCFEVAGIIIQACRNTENGIHVLFLSWERIRRPPLHYIKSHAIRKSHLVLVSSMAKITYCPFYLGYGGLLLKPPQYMSPQS